VRTAQVLRPWSGLAIVALVTLPYFALVVAREPFAPAYWRAQMFDRVGGVASAWWRPIEMYYVTRALELLAPWSLLVASACWWGVRLRRERASAAERMAIHASLAPLIVLSFSLGRKSYYLLPALPIGVVCVVGPSIELARAWAANRARRWWLELATWFHIALLLAVFAATGWMLAERQPWVPLPTARLLTTGAAIAAGVAACGTACAVRRRASAALALVISAAFASSALSSSGAMWRTARYTGGEFARAAACAIGPNDPVVVVDGDEEVLINYLDRHVDRLSHAEALEAARERPGTWIVDVESALASYPTPYVALRELACPGRDAMVLLAPSWARSSQE
jgi:hypothetical protein